MLSLELELVAILVLTAVIGLLMGRFLCKSGEEDEREKKQKFIHAYKTTQNELEFSREKVEEQLSVIRELEDNLAKGEQEISNLNVKLHSSDNEREKLLEELKVLEKYKPRFESLVKEFEIQNKTLDKLKKDKMSNQRKISDFKILTSELNKQITHFKEKQLESKEHIVRLNQELRERQSLYEKSMLNEQKKYKNNISSKTEDYEKSLKILNDKYQSQIEIKEDAYAKLEQEHIMKYKKMVRIKDELYERLKSENKSKFDKLEEDSIKKYKDMVQSKDEALDSLEKNKNKIYHEMLKSKDEALEILEKNKNRVYQDMLESKTREIELLKRELENVENEYEDFKINYNLDTNRLDTLESDYKKVYHTLEKTIIERDDLVARLRAISSVVGAIGVDNGENNQALIENTNKS